MSIEIRVETESGEPMESLDDIGDTLASLLNAGKMSGLLTGIDQYGHTMFNQVQLPAVVAEIDALAGASELTPDTRGFMARLGELVRKYLDEPHVYLWFHGD